MRALLNVFFREIFPTVSYLEHLFRSGLLRAMGTNDKPRALTITASDWSGLRLWALVGTRNRMCVWHLDHIRTTGTGDFARSVRVERDQVLREFPAEAPFLR